MKLFIAGHNGMVGGALVRRFQHEPGVTLLLRTRRELDLTNPAAVAAFYAREKPDTVIMAAAKVGGIHANSTYPADFLYDNLAIASSTIHGAHGAGVKRFLFLGSSASIRNSRRSRCPRAACSPARSSRPTRPTRSPRSRA